MGKYNNKQKMGYFDKFFIKNKTCIITGGAGLIGKKHAEAVIEGKGIPVLLDISGERLDRIKEELMAEYPHAKVEIYEADITDKSVLQKVCDEIIDKYSHVYGLINNAANNPKVEGGSKNLGTSSFCDFPVSLWNEDIAVGLTGAFLCAQVFGKRMAENRNGVIINISSDYGLISPDQRIYKKDGIPENEQIIKPISYSVVKHGIIGLTKYLATYWAKEGIRVNTLCPASLENGQDEEFINKISDLIPMGRMSQPEEYVCTILYMLSDASSYMTGSTVVLDGGRTIW